MDAKKAVMDSPSYDVLINEVQPLPPVSVRARDYIV
jgi:hypothetical protein